MGYSRVKQRAAVEFSIQRFFLRHPVVYFWTITTADNCTCKAEVERRVKPLWDLIKRRGGERLGVWERQQRGAWHLHFLTDKYLDVNWLRPWLVKRGWGPQMRVKKAQARSRWNGQAWEVDLESVKGVAVYLSKYVTKGIEDDYGNKVKPFSVASSARASTVRFSWDKYTNPRAYLYHWGRSIYFEVFNELPTFKEGALLIRLGYEDSGWGFTDPWLIP